VLLATARHRQLHQNDQDEEPGAKYHTVQTTGVAARFQDQRNLA
jgi:hypothetical protein